MIGFVRFELLIAESLARGGNASKEGERATMTMSSGRCHLCRWCRVCGGFRSPFWHNRRCYCGRHALDDVLNLLSCPRQSDIDRLYRQTYLLRIYFLHESRGDRSQSRCFVPLPPRLFYAFRHRREIALYD